MSEEILTKLNQRLEGRVEKQVPLSTYVHFRIGGPAEYFFVARSSEELVAACQVAIELKIPYTILGDGSNVIILDGGIEGLVIKAANKQINFIDNIVEAEAGAVLMEVANKAAERGLSGLEFAGGIYGTVGGAVYGNAGSFGREIKDILISCRFFDPEVGVREIDNKGCQFVYRGSIFKQHRDWVVLSARFNLQPDEPAVVKQRLLELVKKKSSDQPFNLPSSGCIFKNIPLAEVDWSKIEREIEADAINKHSGLTNQECWQRFKQLGYLPVSYLLEELGLKGKRIGQAQLSDKHANFIVNLGGATASEVIMLISYIKQQVRDRVGIQLQEEVQILGK